MDTNTIVVWIAITFVGGVASGLALAAIFGTWRYLGSIVNDIRRTLAALREGNYKEADTYDKRAALKLLGCFGIGLLLEIVLLIGVVIAVLVIVATLPKH